MKVEKLCEKKRVKNGISKQEKIRKNCKAILLFWQPECKNYAIVVVAKNDVSQIFLTIRVIIYNLLLFIADTQFLTK